MMHPLTIAQNKNINVKMKFEIESESIFSGACVLECKSNDYTQRPYKKINCVYYTNLKKYVYRWK